MVLDNLREPVCEGAGFWEGFLEEGEFEVSMGVNEAWEDNVWGEVEGWGRWEEFFEVGSGIEGDDFVIMEEDRSIGDRGLCDGDEEFRMDE